MKPLQLRNNQRFVSAVICIFVAIVLAASTLLFSASCTSVSSVDKDAKTVGISMPTKNLECWVRSANNLKRNFQSLGYNIRLTYADNKIDQQVKDIESLMPDVDLLVVCPIDGSTLGRVINDAKDLNLPVISYDRLAEGSDAVSYFVSFDNFLVGAYQAQYVVDKLGLKDPSDTSKSYNIEFIAGEPTDSNSRAFYDGQVSVLQPYIDSGAIKVPSGQVTFEQVATKGWDRGVASARFQTLLATYYSDGTQIDAVIASNDTVGIVAVQGLASDYTGKNEVLITGQDGDEVSLQSIIDGHQSMTIYKPLVNQALVAATVADKILHGQTPDESLISDSNWNFEVKYYDNKYDNGKKMVPSYILTPIAVDKTNWKEKLLDSGFFELNDKGYPVFPENAK